MQAHTKRRLGIFFVETEPISPKSYIADLLNGVGKYCTQVVVVCAASMADDFKHLYGELCDDIVPCDMQKQDVLWGYRTGLLFIGRERAAIFEEIILFNNSVFGPIRDLDILFETMDQKELDFWGVTLGAAYSEPSLWQHPTPQPNTLDSYFLAVTKHLFSAEAFWQFFQTLPPQATVVPGGASLTTHFASQGYRWASYVEPTLICTAEEFVLRPAVALREGLCPFVKRSSFTSDMADVLSHTMGEGAREALNYLQEETVYDTENILQYLLQTHNMADIKNSLSMNHILSSVQALPGAKQTEPNVALLLHIYYEDRIDYCRSYAASMPKEADVYITTDTVQKRQQIAHVFKDLDVRSVTVEVIPNRGRDVAAFLVSMAKHVDTYDYVCFAHDKKGIGAGDALAGDSFSYLCFESILKSKQYVANVLYTFDANPSLGLLVPPLPLHAGYYGILGFEWRTNYAGCVALIEKMGLSAHIDPDKAPVAPFGSEFWFRPQALKPLFEAGFSYEDFPQESSYKNPAFKKTEHISHQIERIYPVVAQSQGFYSAWVMPENIASLVLTELVYYQREITKAWHRGNKPVGTPFNEFVSTVREKDGIVAAQQTDIGWLKKQLRILQKDMNKTLGLLAGSGAEVSRAHKWIEKNDKDIERLKEENLKVYRDVESIRQSHEKIEQQMQAIIAERDVLLQERDGLCQEKDNLLQKQNTLLAEGDSLRAEKEHIEVEYAASVACLEAQVAQLRGEIENQAGIIKEQTNEINHQANVIENMPTIEKVFSEPVPAPVRLKLIARSLLPVKTQKKMRERGTGKNQNID